MTAIPLHFEVPAKLTTKKLLAKLSKKIVVKIAGQQYMIKTFYDSFDWRLYNAGYVCEFNHSHTESQLRLFDLKTGELIASQEMLNIPDFSDQFPEGRLKEKLRVQLEMRALLPLCQLPHEVYRINVLNKYQKTILRIQLDEYELLANRVSLYPLKGYEKAVASLSDMLQKTFALKPTNSSVLKVALKLNGRKVKEYSSRLLIDLKPAMAADKAIKIIFKQLLLVMRVNETGTIADIDTEFLHDFRVAVRRTRAGLSQLKNTLPATEITPYAEFFAWLGQITGPTRDLDVYLLSYKQYKAALPFSLQADLSPLYSFLKEKQVIAQKQLAKKLNSPEYRKQLASWEEYLKEPSATKAKTKGAQQTIKELADQRIWKVYRKILKEGEAINDNSPAVALHDLRKTCKKLRYLIEFFQSLYPGKDIKVLVKALKSFQEVLGDFQDYEVQEDKIKYFSEEMMANKVSPNTFLAMGVLVQYLDGMKCKARDDFAKQFSLFVQTENRHLFKSLFSHNRTVVKM